MSIEAKVDGVHGTVDEIYITLHGKKELGAKGVMERLETLEDQVNRLDREREAVVAIARGARWIAALGGGGGLIATILNILSNAP